MEKVMRVADVTEHVSGLIAASEASPQNSAPIVQLAGRRNINCSDAVDEYISGADWRIKANANVGYSQAGLISNVAGKVIANFWLDTIYAPEEGLAPRQGDLPIHDLDCLTG